MVVRKLNVKGLENAIQRNAVVLYYAPWCGYCTKFMPEYNKLADELAHNKSIIVSKVNMHKYGDTIKRQATGEGRFGTPVHADIKGFPTVICYKETGERSLYTGPREADIMKDTFSAFYN